MGHETLLEMNRLTTFIVIAAAACSGPSHDTNDGSVTIDSAAAPTVVTVTVDPGSTFSEDGTFIVGYQDGEGPWLPAPTPANDTYTLVIHHSTYGIVWTCAPINTSSDTTEVVTAHFTVAERTSLRMHGCKNVQTPPAVYVSLSGTITNQPTGGTLLVLGVNGGVYSAGPYLVQCPAPAFTSNIDPTTGAYSFPLVIAGTHDLFVGHYPTTTPQTYALDRVAIVRNADVTGSTSVNVDFAASVATRSLPLTITGAGTKLTRSFTFVQGNGAGVSLECDGTGRTTAALGAQQISPTDLHERFISIATSDYLPDYSTVMVDAASNPGTLTIATPPPVMGLSSTVVTTTPYPTVRTSWAPYPGATGYMWQTNQQSLGHQIIWTAWLSAGFSGDSPSVQMPDLTNLPGWSPRFQFIAGPDILGHIEVMTSTAGANDFPSSGSFYFYTGTPLVDGLRRVFTSSSFWRVHP